MSNNIGINTGSNYHRNPIHLHTFEFFSPTCSVVEGRGSSPGEMSESSGKRGLVRPPNSAAVDSNTATSSSSSKTYPHGEVTDRAMLTCSM